jgi:hypothetical protein
MIRCLQKTLTAGLSLSKGMKISSVRLSVEHHKDEKSLTSKSVRPFLTVVFDSNQRI